MKKTIFLVLLISANACYAQKQLPIEIIKGTVVDFLKWHKAGSDFKPGQGYFVPRYDGKDSVKTYFDTDSLENYYNGFRQSGFVSEQYVNELKKYFDYYGKSIGAPPVPGEIVKIDGLDQDIILQTYEPETILNNLSKMVITKSLIVYNKALIAISFSKDVKMVCILTRDKKKWLIDYLGPDNTSSASFFKL